MSLSATNKKKVADVLKALADKNDGVITPDMVLRHARKEDSPLHSCFEWDDTKAAAKFRKIQAENLIRHALDVIETPSGEREARAFWSLSSDRKERPGTYRTIASVMSEEERRRDWLRTVRAEAAAFRKKTALVSELAEVHEAIERFLDRTANVEGDGEAA